MISYEKYLYNDLSISKYEDGLREYGESNNCLNKCLEKIFPNNTFVHNKFIKCNGEYVKNKFDQKIRPDYLCKELKLIVEFDGDSGKNGHYTDPFVILKDEANTEKLIELGYKIIRIPFYIQLNNSSIKYLFNVEDYNGEDLYCSINDHGFKHPLCVLPSQFCEQGLNKLIHDLNNYPKDISNVIKESLKYRIDYCYNQFGKYSESLIIPSYKQKELLN